MTITEEPIANGSYTAYLPIEIEVGSVTANPDYIEFELQDDAGVAQSPKHRAYRLSGNVYRFDVAPYIKPLLDVRSEQGLSTNSIEEMTDIFGTFKVEITDPIASSSAVESNEFVVYAFINRGVFDADETAKVITPLQSEIFDNTKLATTTKRYFGGYARINMKPTTIKIETYRDTLLRQSFFFPLTTQFDDVVSIPISQECFN
jgi:hypothetical protein